MLFRSLQKMQEEIKNKSGSALEFNALDQNALNAPVFKDPYANFNDLNVNELDVEYLGNALDNMLLATFQVGYNNQNQVYIFDKNTYWQVTRNTTENSTILINKDRGYNITIIQDGSTAQVQNQDSTTNNIFIKQTK